MLLKVFRFIFRLIGFINKNSIFIITINYIYYIYFIKNDFFQMTFSKLNFQVIYLYKTFYLNY